MKNVDKKVVEDFGDEWLLFDQSCLSTEERLQHFNSYFDIFPWDSLPIDPIGFDAGCGSGRWAYLVAPRVRVLHCIEPSKSINVAKSNLSNYQKAYEAFAFADRELVPLVAKIECPTSIITGENDVNSTPSMAHALSKRIKGSDVKLLLGLAHGAPIEAPKKFAQALKEMTLKW